MAELPNKPKLDGTWRPIVTDINGDPLFVGATVRNVETDDKGYITEIYPDGDVRIKWDNYLTEGSVCKYSMVPFRLQIIHEPAVLSAREPLGERWDLIPGLYKALAQIAKISSLGAEKYGDTSWKQRTAIGDESPINHVLRHTAKALEYEFGTEERIRQLSKAAWNILAQIELES